MKTISDNVAYLTRTNTRQHGYLARELAFYNDRVKESWGGRHIMHGRMPDSQSILLVSNDYLALSNHPEILQAQANALLKQGNGLLMSGIFLHGNNPQAALEERLAAFLRVEKVVLCQSGWCANVGLLQSIADDSTNVYIDTLAHMSLWEGARIAGARIHTFQHNNANHLEKQIKKHSAGIIAVDSVYSSNGSVCPLTDIVAVAQRYNCVLLVDESHSLGTHGPNGAGLVAQLGLSNKVQFITASLAKAFAGRAGIITCNTRFSDYFKFTSMPSIFSSTLLLHEIAALQKTLDVIMMDDQGRARLHENASTLKNHLLNLGYNVTISNSQILALEAGTEQNTMRLRDALEARNVFGSIFCAPATAKNRSLLRFSINAGLTKTQLEYIANACRDIREIVDLANWPSTLKLAS